MPCLLATEFPLDGAVLALWAANGSATTITVKLWLALFEMPPFVGLSSTVTPTTLVVPAKVPATLLEMRTPMAPALRALVTLVWKVRVAPVESVPPRRMWATGG